MIEDYFQTIADILRSTPLIRAHDVTFDKRAPDLGYLRGNIFFSDGSLLHFREMVNTTVGVDRFSYSYHYQRADGSFVFRNDNSDHFPPPLPFSAPTAAPAASSSKTACVLARSSGDAAAIACLT